jgi:hypothetical protein
MKCISEKEVNAIQESKSCCGLSIAGFLVKME